MSCGEGSGKVVCVTGAAGYIASWIVKLLLQRGYNVKATLRNPCDPKKTEHLLALDGAKERLELFKADVVDEGAFDSIVEGCVGVFHTATPVLFSSSDPQTELLTPAVNGTLNVLKSCAKVPSIKRVIITSSLATIVFHGKTLTPDVVVDETWYSDAALCKEREYWYMLAKTLSEHAATKFAKENAIDLVTIHPSFVLGPLLQPTLNASVEVILQVIKAGALPPIGTSYRYVDVRDVAYAHILAFEVPSANGRYCLSGRAAHYSEILKILHKLYPTLHLNENVSNDRFEDDKIVEPAEHVSDEKAKGLGVNFMPLETTIRDTIENLKEKNLFNI